MSCFRSLFVEIFASFRRSVKDRVAELIGGRSEEEFGGGNV